MPKNIATMILSLNNSYLLMFIVIVSKHWRQVSAGSNNIWVEFEILNYSNDEGRLESGDCCSGYKSSLDAGTCRGNSSCSPFWKICLTHVPATNTDKDWDNFVIPLSSRSTSSFLPRHSSKKRRNSSKIRTSSTSSPYSSTTSSTKSRTKSGSISLTTSSPKASNISKTSSSPASPAPSSSSIIKSFLTRIWVPTIKIAQTLGNFVITGDFDSSIYDSEPSACSIAFFSTNITGPDDFPVILRAKVPKAIFTSPSVSSSSLTRSASFSRLADASLPASWRSRSRSSESSLESTDASSSSMVKLQKVLVVVEIWNKGKGEDSQEDKLIARLVEQKNVKIQTKQLQTSSLVTSPETPDDKKYQSGNNWEEGGIPSKIQSSSSSANYSSIRDRNSSSTSSSNFSNNSMNTTSGNYSGVRFGYRWRIIRDASPVSSSSSSFTSSSEEDSVAETTTKMICPSGFRGSDCKEAICASGCHSSHGYCEKPGECKCKFGWTGETCHLCVPMPGCNHGSCIKPFECRCEDGWTGMFCDKPTCKIGCHPQNGYCELPGECRCRFGFRGDNCSDCSTMPGCQRGSCEQPLDCNCDVGWKGLFCSIPTCSQGCDLDHGWCRRPDECRCRVGWTGRNCTECVPYPGCQHGSCSDPWTCNCEPGWGGVTCDEKLDYCETHDGPCKNGGTCISVEKSDGGFRCQCPPEFQGKTCDTVRTYK